MNKLAVLQSNYIPWRGYFDIINDVDLFIFYDEVQYTKNDWRNRNKIITPKGAQWLTLPCGYDITQKINEVKLKNELGWQKKHYDALCANYKNAPHFKKYKDFLDYVYIERKWDYLFELNRYIIKTVSQDFLKINTTFKDSTDYATHGTRGDKLLSLLQAAGAEHYLSGPAAKNYINPGDYKNANIALEWKDYSGYPDYPQQAEGFIGDVSILDLLFNTGDDAPYYIWGHRQ